MDVERDSIDGPMIFTSTRIVDDRGWFSECLRINDLRGKILDDIDFVQYNHSMSIRSGTIRGLHFQALPKAQGKLVRCVRGKILDVVVDLRKSSKSYGRYVKETLSSENGNSFWVPPGFAHGFLTLEDNTEVLYFTTEYYSPDHDRGILWSDLDIAIDWGVDERQVIVSERDRQLPRLCDIDGVFP